MIVRHSVVVDWQSNEEIKRLMRRDIKRELRPTGDFTEEQLRSWRTGSWSWPNVRSER